MERVSRVAPLDRPVLVIGERGTGKELIAARLHYLSRRWDRPLITLNAAALPETLLDSELFGHEAGAFTGALRQRRGRFELANGGSLFLDEIASTSLAVQERLLRVVEYGAFERVGGSLNAYTSREHTAYYARILADDVGLAADILADILQHSTFDAAELEKERHVILQEIGQVKDTPDDLVFDLLQEASYPDQPMGRAILGPESIVAGMPREALVEYMARHYGPRRMVFAGAGKLGHGRLVELADRLFGELPATEGETAEPARYAGGIRIEHRADRRDMHQRHAGRWRAQRQAQREVAA